MNTRGDSGRNLKLRTIFCRYFYIRSKQVISYHTISHHILLSLIIPKCRIATPPHSQSIYLSIYLYIYISNLSIYLSIYVRICVFVCLFIFGCTYIYVCIYVSLILLNYQSQRITALNSSSLPLILSLKPVGCCCC